MRPLLSILIPRLPEPEREHSYKLLRDELERQIAYSGESLGYEILDDPAPRGKLIGDKRNDLLQAATGQYIAFVDDDDQVSINYIKLITETIRQNNYPDCISLKGVITWNGDWNTAELFEHSLRYNAYRTNEQARFNLFHWVSTSTADVKYERFPNHLSCIKAEIAKQFEFPSNNFGEDTDWATQIHNSGLIKTEGYISEVLYHYNYISNK